MLTSRAGEKHRCKAFEVGATEYLVKPYQDEHLLGVIRQLLPPASGVMAA
jgi:chemosensory pili system protein ChpA (sensor histidine kinase/response regulator)